MKKSSALFAFAMAACLTASAAVEQKSASAKDATVAGSIELTAAEAASPAKFVRQNGPKKISQVSDLYGIYNNKYSKWMLEGDDRFGGSLTTVIKAGSTPTEVVITGLPYSDVEVKGNVDLTNGTIVVPTQDTGYFMSNYGENMMFSGMPAEVEDAGDGKVNISWPNEGGNFTFTIMEDGSLFTYDACAMRVTAGYFFAAGIYEAAPLDYFVYNANEWEVVGTADVEEENCFSYFFKEEYRPGKVTGLTLLRNKADDGLIAIQNPYGTSEWSQLNAASLAGKSTDGFYVFNISNTDCVCMRPLTGSGFWFDSSDDQSGMYEEGFPFNSEGKRLFIDGWDIEDIWAEIAAAGACSTLEGETMTIENMYFGSTESPLAYYWFGEDTPITMQFTLKMTGVDDIAVDENAPVKYYNLQGMEIVNPAKGQVVIKTQGKKATKVVVK